jgi:GAF domain-containing protein
MRTPPDNASGDPEQIIADLRRQLAECQTERDEGLQRETAIAEVLQVINSSPGDLVPVLDAMLEKAMRLCEAPFGALRRFDGEVFRAIVARDVSGAVAVVLDQPIVPDPGSASERLVMGDEVIHIPDVVDTDAFRSGVPSRLRLVEMFGARTALWVALRKNDVLLGDLAFYRTEVRPFTDKQIGLLQSFAAQAVIAMENARLLTETREALEQQTATAAVLRTINASPGELAPVFNAILDWAHRVCDADGGVLYTFDGAHVRVTAVHGFPPEHAAEMLSRAPYPPPNATVEQMIATRRFIQVEDAQAGYENGKVAHPRDFVESGMRTAAAIPLLKDGRLVGYITAWRREVRLFSDKQIALLENFAAQAVIAMENARLLGELRQRTDALEEALEYQTATSDVLKVISRSTFDLQTVLDTLVTTAARLCGATRGFIATRDEESFRPVATIAASPEAHAFLRGMFIKPGLGTIAGEALLERKAVHVADIAADPAYASAPAVVTPGAEPPRSLLGVPLLRESELIGVILLARSRVEPFTDRQIELVRTFADQAVIAMENARLINETREALEQQTATAEVLQVTNSSPGDLTPVFDVILEKVHNLCGVTHGALVLREGEIFRAVATHSYSGSFAEELRQGYRGADNPLTRALIDGERFVHIPDLAQIDHPMVQASVENAGVRTGLY